MAELGRQLTRGRADEALVARVVEGLAFSPPECCERIGRELYDLARLDRRHFIPRRHHYSSFWMYLHYWLRGQAGRLKARRDKRLLASTSGLERVFLFHGDGWMREAALKQLNGPLEGPFFVVAVAYRMNDWVEPVRRAAAACAARTFAATDAAVLAPAALVLQFRKESWQRWASERGALDLVLMRPDVLAVLAETVATSPTGPMTCLLRRLLAYPEIDGYLLRLLTAIQPGVRAMALSSLINGCVRWPRGTERQWVDKSMGRFRIVPAIQQRNVEPGMPLQELIEFGLRDRSGFVRKTALDGLIRNRAAIDGIAQVVERFASDPSPAVRQRIAFLEKEIAAARVGGTAPLP